MMHVLALTGFISFFAAVKYQSQTAGAKKKRASRNYSKPQRIVVCYGHGSALPHGARTPPVSLVIVRADLRSGNSDSSASPPPRPELSPRRRWAVGRTCLSRRTPTAFTLPFGGGRESRPFLRKPRSPSHQFIAIPLWEYLLTVAYAIVIRRQPEARATLARAWRDGSIQPFRPSPLILARPA